MVKRKYYDSTFLLRALNSYHTDDIVNVYYQAIDTSINVTPTIKKRLLSILKNEWTDEELEPIVDKKVRRSFESMRLGNILDKVNKKVGFSKVVYDSVYKQEFAKKFKEYSKTSPVDLADSYAASGANAKATEVSEKYNVSYDSVYRAIYDSTLLVYRKEKENDIRKRPVPIDIVLPIAAARVYEAMPILRKDILSDKPIFSKVNTEIALAVLGDDEYKGFIIQQHNKYIAQKPWNYGDFLADNAGLILLKSQDNYALFADWLDTTSTYLGYSESGDYTGAPIYYTSAQFIPSILWLLKNKDLIEGYIMLNRPGRYESYSSDTASTPQQIMFVKNWLIANKGKYEFW